jgi:hypothetical protein
VRIPGPWKAAAEDAGGSENNGDRGVHYSGGSWDPLGLCLKEPQQLLVFLHPAWRKEFFSK